VGVHVDPDVVDELHDAKAIDATRRKLNNAQMIPFFMHNPFV